MIKRSKEKNKEKEIAKRHVSELFLEADKAFSKNPKLSDKYVKKAIEISQKFRLKMPTEYKRRFCKSCKKYLVPSLNCKVRINAGKVIYHCFSCKNIMRIPLKPKR